MFNFKIASLLKHINYFCRQTIINRKTMKRIMLLLAMTFATTAFLSAQNNDLEKWKSKDDIYVGSRSSNVTKTNSIRESDQLMTKSIRCQYAAISCAGVGTALAITGAIIGTKTYQEKDGSLEPDYKKKSDSDRKTRKALFIGSGISFAAALCCEFAALDYKLKAGRSFKLYATGTGGGLSYNF